MLPVRGCCGTAPDLALGRALGSTDLVLVRGPALDPAPAGTPESEEANVCCAVSCGLSAASGEEGCWLSLTTRDDDEFDLRELDWHSAWGSLCWSA